MNRPEAGSAVAITVLDMEGKERTFRLALVKDDTFTAFNGNPSYDYMYVDSEGNMFSSTYSGGVTGSGVDWHNIHAANSDKPNPYYDRFQVISTDRNEINELVDEINRAEEAKLQARKLEKELKEAAVAAAVELDKPITVYKDEAVEVFVIPRFYQTAGGSRRFEVRNMYTRNAAWGERERLFRVEDLFTPSGRVSTKATKLFGTAGTVIAIKTKEASNNLYRIYNRA